MLDVPIDALYVWLALAAASLVVLGVAVTLPRAPPPDAAAVADTVDTVAASPHPSTAEHAIAAAHVRLGPRRIALRTDAGTARARFVYGPVTPAAGSDRLQAVLRGTPPGQVFETPRAFRSALRNARQATPAWRPAGERVVVRSVSWEGVDATIVGA